MKLVHGPFDTGGKRGAAKRRQKKALKTRIQHGGCDCQLCQERERPLARTKGLIWVRQPLPSQKTGPDGEPVPRGARVTDPLWLAEPSDVDSLSRPDVTPPEHLKKGADHA